MTQDKNEQKNLIESINPNKEAALNSEGAARRKALAALAKHAAYTAPAVLAIFSATTHRAKAGSF
ncbi:MAG TPA: hypothetical protein VME69_06135 [Methylocella sp.]|nr:hypothetical protein [Methylocella sp.]